MKAPQKPLRLPESMHDPWIGGESYVVKCSSCRRKSRSPGSRQTSHATHGVSSYNPPMNRGLPETEMHCASKRHGRAIFAKPGSARAATRPNCFDPRRNLASTAAPELTIGRRASNRYAGLPSCNGPWGSLGTSCVTSRRQCRTRATINVMDMSRTKNV